MTKKDIFQFVNKLSDMGIPTMIYRETVFDIISFGKSSKIYLSSTSSIEKIKKELCIYNAIDVQNEPDTIKFTIDGDTFFVRSIADMSYDDFIKNVVATNLTFNSLLMKPNGQIFDMHNGLSDLRKKQLRFVHDFDEKNKNALTLNCIRYIYRNGFQCDDRVKQYIERSILTFSKSEKTNALFYLIEHISHSNNGAYVTLILNNEFFKSDKNPDINISDYCSIIDRIGISNFIYLLMLLLNVNVNKSRFASIINAEEYNNIKADFSIDLHNETNYITVKEKCGEDYLHQIIGLQKEFAYVTNQEYAEPQFNKKTIFDMIEQSDSFVSTLDDLFLCDENLPSPEENTSDTASISAIENQQTQPPNAYVGDSEEVLSNIFSDGVENQAMTITEGNDSESITHGVEMEIPNDVVDAQVLEDAIENIEKANEETDSAVSEDNASAKELDISTTTNDTADDTNYSISDETKLVEDNEMQDTQMANETLDASDDISSILNSDDERTNFGSGRRSVNPRLGQNATAFTSVAKENRNRSTREKRTLNANSFPRTRAEVAAMRTSADNFNLDEMFATNGAPSAPVTPVQSHTMTSRTANVIDSIFEEEVKVPEITLAPEFGTLIAQVAEENKDNDTEKQGVRNVVTETLMTDVVPEWPETVSQNDVSQTQETPEVFEINEQDLEEILAELNGKKKNTFLDDDSTPIDMDDEIISYDQSSYTPQTPPPQDEGDDFFRTLNDDFAEIVGGNS